MPRYELKDGKSNKFWEITQDGDSFTVRYGRIGTDGQTSTKTFASVDKATAEAEKLTRSKTKKGYLLVEGADEPADSAGNGDAAAAGGVDPELEKSLFENPDDLETWQVYADALQEKGDPRGELIGIDISLASKKNAKLSKRREALIAENQKAWLGKTLMKALESDDVEEWLIELEWKLGYIHKARLRTEMDVDDLKLAQMLRALLKLDSAKFLAELHLGISDWEGENGYDAEMLALSKVGKLHALRKLYIGDFIYPDETEMSWTMVGNVDRIWPVVPNLRWLKVQGGGIVMKKVEHPKIEELYVHTGGLPKPTARGLAKAKLPSAHTMEIWLGTEDYEGDSDIDALGPIFASKELPALRNLGLMNADFQNDIARACCDAPIIKQLETLDLSMGTMTDEGATAIVENAAHFKHLKKLNLDENFISDDAQKALEKALGDIVAIGDQEEPDDDYVYVSVGE